jgi:hypothetical protein
MDVDEFYILLLKGSLHVNCEVRVLQYRICLTAIYSTTNVKGTPSPVKKDCAPLSLLF